jgi:hypothetical protein
VYNKTGSIPKGYNLDEYDINRLPKYKPKKIGTDIIGLVGARYKIPDRLKKAIVAGLREWGLAPTPGPGPLWVQRVVFKNPNQGQY